jgi:DNA polymerase-1
MLYLIDASVYVFRAWFSIPDDMQDGEGKQVNALYGFTRFLGDFLEYTKPEYVAVAFDTSHANCFRNDIYPEYKANRDPAPEELKQQFERCREVTRALGLQDFAEQRYEADDIIGTLVTRMRRKGMRSTILSRDKDLAQLLDAGDVMWDFAGGKRTHYKDVPEKYGVRAEQIVDYLALAGDSVDNIPGVRGVGAKTAAALLKHFDSMDEIYARLDEVSGVPVRGAGTLAGKLVASREDALMSRRLTQIECDVPLAIDRDSEHTHLKRTPPNLESLNALYDKADFGQMLRRQAERIIAHT